VRRITKRFKIHYGPVELLGERPVLVLVLLASSVRRAAGSEASNDADA